MEPAIEANFLDDFLLRHKLPAVFSDTVAQYFLPLAKKLNSAIDAHKGTFYLGVNGCQGSGKSTLSDFLGEWLGANGYSCAVMSLDDFYLDRKKRQSLSSSISPLLATRGVPGTHDTQMMRDTLKQLGESGSVSLPRFNKADDNPFPQNQWPRIKAPVDVVIMEGWCWGVTAQTPLQLRYPVNALEAEQDPNLIWRNWVNLQIQTHYQPLHELMDFWVMLQAPGFDNVFKWRLEQEQKLSATLKDKTQHVMDEIGVLEFIQYYQRLTEVCLSTLPERSDVVFKLDSNRAILEVRGL